MEHYINQLIQDLKDFCDSTIPAPFVKNPFEIDEFSEDVEYEFATYKPISEWIGIESNFFPPEDRLNQKQRKKLAEAMCKVFGKINIELSFPRKMPLAKRYSLLLREWNEPVPFLSAGGYYIDFCSGNCEVCQVKEYCEVRLKWEM